MKKYVKYVVWFGCLILFGFIAFNVYKTNEFYSDGVIYDFVYKYIISDKMTSFVKFITWFGSTVGIIVVGLISICIIKNKRINISLTMCLILGTTINNVIKLIFVRERPDINPLMVENGYSFPSGHSMMSMILYGYLIYFIYNNFKGKKYKWILITCLLILILCIGFSRIYLGVHYVSDVIGGFVLGIVYLILYIDISNKIIKKT